LPSEVADAPVEVPGVVFVAALDPEVPAAFWAVVPELLALFVLLLVVGVWELPALLLDPDPGLLGAVGADVGVTPGT